MNQRLQADPQLHVEETQNTDGPGESLSPCHGLMGTLHTGDVIDCNTRLHWEC